jgi:ankyrin repeat protein
MVFRACRSPNSIRCQFLETEDGSDLIVYDPPPFDAFVNISLVIEDGADVNWQDPYHNGFTPLHHAAVQGNVTVIEELIRLGANVNARSTLNVATPLHMAAGEDKPKAVRALLEHGAELEARNKFEQTPLHIAAMLARELSTRALVEAGADLFVKDFAGKTPSDRLGLLSFKPSAINNLFMFDFDPNVGPAPILTNPTASATPLRCPSTPMRPRPCHPCHPHLPLHLHVPTILCAMHATCD